MVGRLLILIMMGDYLMRVIFGEKGLPLGIILLVGVFLFGGCDSFKQTPKIELEQAHQKVVDVLRDESNLPDAQVFPVFTSKGGVSKGFISLFMQTSASNLPESQVFPVDDTVWIYVPFDGPLTDYKASRKKATVAVSEDEAEEKWVVNRIAVAYQDPNFEIAYDIRPRDTYPTKDLGYSSAYTDAFNGVYQKVLYAVRSGYFDAAEPPTFIVIVIADVVRGVKITYTMTLNDYKYSSLGQLPQEEFMKRMLTEIAGDQALIGDREGRSLKPEPVTWSDFVARQIENRINFRYGRSSFPPSGNPQDEILYQVNQAFNAADFSDCSQIVLRDLRFETEKTVSCADIANFSEQPLPAGGKLHTITFFPK